MVNDTNFRVWSVNGNEYLNDGDVLLGMDGTMYDGRRFDEYDGLSNPYFMEPLRKDKFLLELFTGMAGAGDVGIYNGDIILDALTGAKYVVFWSDERLGWFLQPIGVNQRDVSLSMFAEYCAEIIGNIHQNQELFEDSND